MTKRYKKKPTEKNARWLTGRLVRECGRHKMSPLDVMDAGFNLGYTAAVQLGLGQPVKEMLEALHAKIENMVQEEKKTVAIDFTGEE